MKQTREGVFEIIRQNPGATGYEIWLQRIRLSRSARWFGEDSILTVMFGPGTANLYLTLAQLERAGRVTSHWGVAKPGRGGHRPRHYYVLEQMHEH